MVEETLDVRRRRYADDVTAWSPEGGLEMRRVAEAFAAVPREAFMPPPPWRILSSSGLFGQSTSDPRKLYDDVLVVLDEALGINNGQPALHAAWMGAVAPKPGERVVMVGAGSGYYAAILAELVGPRGSVAAYEIVPRLAEMARTNLAPWPQVRVTIRAAIEPTEADVVYVAAAAPAPQAAWLRALRPGGRLVMPWAPTGARGVTLLVRRTGAGIAARALFGVSFIPCAGAGEGVELRTGADPGTVRSIRLRADGEPDDTAIAVGEEVWCSAADPA